MKDHPIKGIIMMLSAVFLMMTMNMFAKMVSDQMMIIEVVFWRGLFALPIIFAIIAYKKDWSVLKTTRPKDQIIRGTAGSIGMGCVFWAYSLMPMADVVAIMFTAGLMTTGVSAIWLREKVGVYRWGAVAIGFIGAVIAAAPSGGAEWDIKGVSVALAAAFVGGAIVSTMLRSLGKTEKALTTVFYTLCMNLVIAAPFLIAYGSLPTFDMVPALVGCGIAGGFGLIFKTQAFRYAEASLLSPIHYTSIIWATLFGWLIWNDFPTANVWIGASIIIASNIVIIWREKVKSKKDPSPLK